MVILWYGNIYPPRRLFFIDTILLPVLLVQVQHPPDVCVCFLPIHSGHMSSSLLDVPAGVTQEEGHTGFFIHLLSAVRALVFLARRIQSFLSLVDREVELCVLTI